MMFARSRATRKHVDRDFLTPDGKYSFRSKTAALEYILLLGRISVTLSLCLSFCLVVSCLSLSHFFTLDGLYSFRSKTAALEYILLYYTSCV